MITARLYSPEVLTPQYEEAIYHGLDIVGLRVGRIAVLNSHRIKLPRARTGLVDITKVRYKNFDPLTELHVIIAPVTLPNLPNQEFLGLSYFGSGVAFVNPDNIASLGGMITVAHETSHALGFVTRKSPQSIPNDVTHCKDNCCIMSPKLHPETYPDFCSPCVRDIDENADRNIANMLLRRNVIGEVTSSFYIDS